MAHAIPSGYHSVTPNFTFTDSKKAIEFYKGAFGAEVLDYMEGPGGNGVMHATLKIGNSIVMLGDERPGGEGCPKSAETLGSSPIGLYLYVHDVDAAFQKAVKAGAIETMPVMDMFWGDRAGQVKDPFGYDWMIATHTRDLTHDEIAQGAKEFMEKMAGK